MPLNDFISDAPSLIQVRAIRKKCRTVWQLRKSFTGNMFWHKRARKGFPARKIFSAVIFLSVAAKAAIQAAIAPLRQGWVYWP